MIDLLDFVKSDGEKLYQEYKKAYLDKFDWVEPLIVQAYDYYRLAVKSYNLPVGLDFLQEQHNCFMVDVTKCPNDNGLKPIDIHFSMYRDSILIEGSDSLGFGVRFQAQERYIYTVQWSDKSLQVFEYEIVATDYNDKTRRYDNSQVYDLARKLERDCFKAAEHDIELGELVYFDGNGTTDIELDKVG